MSSDLMTCFQILRIYIILLLMRSSLGAIDLQINLKSRDIIISGTDTAIITDKEISAFGIHDDVLKKCTQEYLGGRPTDVFTRSPTPWGDLYRKYGWIQTHRYLTPISATLNKFTISKVLLKQDILQNNDLKPLTYAFITFHIKNNFSTQWRENMTLTDYNLKLTVLNDDDQDVHTAKEFVFRPNLNVTVEPGEELFIELYASRKRINITVEFEASLSGNMVLNYDRKFRGHHFYGPNLETIIEDCGISDRLRIKADVLLEYFNNFEVELKDKTGKKIKK